MTTKDYLLQSIPFILVALAFIQDRRRMSAQDKRLQNIEKLVVKMFDRRIR